MEFSKELTWKDLGSFHFPLQWLELFGDRFLMQLHVTDGVGFFWEFFWCLKWNEVEVGGFGAFRPVMACLQPDGWLAFVNFKGLQVGDRIVLDMVPNKFRGTEYRIRAQKRNDRGYWIDV